MTAGGSSIEHTVVKADCGRAASSDIRHDWTRAEIAALFEKPFLDLVFHAASIHRTYHNPHEVQVCSLLSIKTGGCPEDCGYCSQSVHHETGLKAEPLLNVEEVMSAAKKAKAAGATRFCMGAAWREVRDNRAFDRVLDMVRGVRGLDMEVCCTLGMLNEDQARQLKEAGLHAYNHNIDTSPENYSKVCSTRTIEDRLNTLAAARNAGLTVCCGGILGLGESAADRVGMIHTLATLSTHPESVPINSLVKIEGTPFAGNPDVSVWDFIRTIAVARITMPRAMVRLAAGRLSLSPEAQALAFMAGANSIFAGEKLLTTPNPEFNEDMAFLKHLGLRGMAPEPSMNPQEAHPEKENGCCGKSRCGTQAH